ncbi:MAG: ribbon-helix-helix domain-containing protein [Anaerolineae bacterium]|nr:ribbon-helix-helix domain-containing protein [Anaerolineae bacterium]
MATKVRKQIYIESHQDTVLKQLSRETGASAAEIIRQAIDQHTQRFRTRGRNLKAWQEERAFIAYLIEQGPVPGGRTWQRDDLYER